MSRKSRIGRKIEEFEKLSTFPFLINQNQNAILVDCEEGFLCKEWLAFESNLNESAALASTLHFFVSEREAARLFHSMHSANRIMAIDPKSVLKKLQGTSAKESVKEDKFLEDNTVTLERSLQEFTRIVKSEEIPEDNDSYFFFEAVLDECLLLLKDTKLLKQSSLFLRISYTQAWTAFEIFIRDVIMNSLNEFPSLAVRLDTDQEFKGRFGPIRFSLLDLDRYDFSMKCAVGTFLTERIDISSVNSIYIVLKAMGLEDKALFSMLKSSELFHIQAKRNLIIHQRALIDKRFIKQTNCTQVEGETLAMDSETLQREVLFLRNVGATVYSAVNQTVRDLSPSVIKGGSSS